MIRKKESICAVIVTYNRKKLLIECLEALLNQSYALNAILIVDNASTDGTPEFLKEKRFINKIPKASNVLIELHEIYKKKRIIFDIFYIRMDKNTGGAGGFHEGVKRGYEKGFEWLWLMDDDGIPDRLALNNLVQNANNYNQKIVLNCLVINKNNSNELAFPLMINNKSTFDSIEVQRYKNAIHGGNPFNGTFIPRDIIKKIGFPKKAYFIKGDEKDYYNRIQKHFQFLTCKHALLFHPKPSFIKKKFLTKKIIFENNNLKSYYYLRNSIWLCRKYSNKWKYFKIAKLIIHAIVEIMLVNDKIERLIYTFKAIKNGITKMP